MEIQQAKDEAAQKAGYKDWDHAVYLMNECGISALTDCDLYIIADAAFKDGFSYCQQSLGSVAEYNETYWIAGRVTNFNKNGEKVGNL